MIIKVKEIPEKIEKGSNLEIMTTDVSYFTHGFFKYPCKFIPQIPRWAILKYTNKGDYVLDPFAGSGTSLVEAVLNQRNGLAVDFDKLSQLLCKTKTSLMSKKQLEKLKTQKPKFFSNSKVDNTNLPDLHNTYHWFSQQNVDNLCILKSNIEQIYKDTQDKQIYNFLLVCFASIIKKTSYTDDSSPKPYVSKRIKKIPMDVKKTFLKIFDSYVSRYEEYLGKKIGKSYQIAEDARDINVKKYINKVSLAITSPPYINAFDYVRSLRLENAWLGFYGDKNIMDIKKRQIGTENFSVKLYGLGVKKTNINILDELLKKIMIKDKKRAYVVYKYFEDMATNFEEVFKLLKIQGHYVVVVGDSNIRGIEVPTKDILIEIAQSKGYKLSNVYSYIIKNRYLRIPRAGRGGYIDKDWVIDLEK